MPTVQLATPARSHLPRDASLITVSGANSAIAIALFGSSTSIEKPASCAAENPASCGSPAKKRTAVGSSNAPPALPFQADGIAVAGIRPRSGFARSIPSASATRMFFGSHGPSTRVEPWPAGPRTSVSA